MKRAGIRMCIDVIRQYGWAVFTSIDALKRCMLDHLPSCTSEVVEHDTACDGSVVICCPGCGQTLRAAPTPLGGYRPVGWPPIDVSTAGAE